MAPQPGPGLALRGSPEKWGPSVLWMRRCVPSPGSPGSQHPGPDPAAACLVCGRPEIGGFRGNLDQKFGARCSWGVDPDICEASLGEGSVT